MRRLTHFRVVGDKEGRGAVSLVEVLGEHADPGVVAVEMDPLLAEVHLEDDVVLLEGLRVQIDDKVDEARHCSCCDALRMGNKTKRKIH